MLIPDSPLQYLDILVASLSGQGIHCLFPDERVVLAQVLNEPRMHDLGVLGQKRHDNRNADATADVSSQAEDGCPLCQDVPGEGREGDDAQRREDKTEPEALQQPGRDDRAHPHIEREPGHLPHRHCGNYEARQDDQPDINAPDQAGEIPFSCGMGMYQGLIVVK